MEKKDPQKGNVCNHFFVTCEKREVASCLGSHRAQCKHCKLNALDYACELTEDYFYKKCKENPSSVGKEESQEKEMQREKEIHFHIWDEDATPVKCVSSVTDWQASRHGVYVRRICGQVLETK